jgi:dTDP-L-rhamnose 4-epimerase
MERALDFPGCSPLPVTAADTWPMPVSVYGSTKLAQEHMLSSWASAFGSQLTILRLQNVYGPGQSLANAYTGIVSLFCRIARKGRSIPLYEDGKMLRDFVFIDDVADAILRGATSDARQEHPYDVGTGCANSIATLAKDVAALYHAPPPHVCGKYRFGDVRHAACSIEATTHALGWKPRHTPIEGLRLLSAWIESQLVYS